MSHQDWEPHVIHSKDYHAHERRQKQNAAGTKRSNELNEPGEIPSLKKITSEQSKDLMAARNAKGLDRKGLAQLIPHLKIKTIEEYENGTTKDFHLATYNKMMRALGIKPENK